VRYTCIIYYVVIIGLLHSTYTYYSIRYVRMTDGIAINFMHVLCELTLDNEAASAASISTSDDVKPSNS